MIDTKNNVVQGDHQGIHHEKHGRMHPVFRDNHDIQSDNISQ